MSMNIIKQGKILRSYFSGEDITLPANVTEIGKGAF